MTLMLRGKTSASRQIICSCYSCLEILKRTIATSTAHVGISAVLITKLLWIHLYFIHDLDMRYGEVVNCDIAFLMRKDIGYWLVK